MQQDDQEDHSAFSRLNTHERVCAERYGAIIQRIGRIENILWAVIGAICLSFLGILTGLIVDKMHITQSDSPPGISR